MVKEFWIKLVQKTFVAFGVGYFSIAVGTQTWNSFLGPAAGAGLYFFMELGRHWKVNSYNDIQRQRHKKTKDVHFLL